MVVWREGATGRRRDAVPGAMSHSGVTQVRTHMHALSLHKRALFYADYKVSLLLFGAGEYFAQPPGTESLSDLGQTTPGASRSGLSPWRR